MKWVSSILAASCLIGCHPKQKPVSDERLARLHTTWVDMPTGVEQKPVAVTQGTTPLVHIFDLGGPIRVVDLTANAQIAAATVGNQTLVRIDDRNGVVAGKETIAPGPLAAGHEYVIYADPTTSNKIQSGVGPPARADHPKIHPQE